jgi:uncharacterized membrane protein YvbJ
MKYLNANFEGRKIAVGVWEQSGRAKNYSGQVFCPDCGEIATTTHQSTENKAKNQTVANLRKHYSKRHK